MKVNLALAFLIDDSIPHMLRFWEVEVGQFIDTADHESYIGHLSKTNPVDTGRFDMVFLVSDQASPAWADGKIAQWVNEAMRYTCVGVLSLMPSHFWRRAEFSDDNGVLWPRVSQTETVYPMWVTPEDLQDMEGKFTPPVLMLAWDNDWTFYFRRWVEGDNTLPAAHLELNPPPQKARKDRQLTDELWSHFVSTNPRPYRRFLAYLASVTTDSISMAHVTWAVAETRLAEPEFDKGGAFLALYSYLVYPEVGEDGDFCWRFIEGAQERLMSTLPQYRIPELRASLQLYGVIS
jgi:hypothetical protein